MNLDADRVYFDEESRPVAADFFDFDALDDPRIDDETEQALILERSCRIAIKHMRKNGCGRRGLPKAVIATMYSDYRRIGSLAKVAHLYGRSRQALWDLFHAHGLKMNDRNFHGRILFDGRYWTPGKNGYYRPTTGDRTEKLHYAMWEKKTGRKVPGGWQVTFRDGDNTNFKRSNLTCLPIADVTRLHHRRRYPGRSWSDETEKREFWRKQNRDNARRRAAHFRSIGLRSDGKPRLRKEAA